MKKDRTMSDPLIALLDEYQAQLAIFNANAKGSNDEYDAIAQATYMPMWIKLGECPPRPTTYAGAMAGINFILAELADNAFSDATEAVLRVCADFLNTTTIAANA